MASGVTSQLCCSDVKAATASRHTDGRGGGLMKLFTEIGGRPDLARVLTSGLHIRYHTELSFFCDLLFLFLIDVQLIYWVGHKVHLGFS